MSDEVKCKLLPASLRLSGKPGGGGGRGDIGGGGGNISSGGGTAEPGRIEIGLDVGRPGVMPRSFITLSNEENQYAH